jgi:perosamine synthetase
LQALLLDESVAAQRDAILTATNDAGLMTRPAWTLMHQLEPYSACPRMETPVAASLQRRLVNLPSSSHLDKGRA